MKTVYFISGLGADKRVFADLVLPNIKAVYIEWLPPDQADSLASYAKKLLPQIDLEDAVTLVGLSFGGMLAVEISHLIPQCQVVLLSSALSSKDIPKHLIFLGRSALPDKIPFSFFSRANTLTYYFFGVKTPKHRMLLSKILEETDEAFFRWAIAAIVYWESPLPPHNLIQIHGTKDRILPLPKKPSNEVLVIEGGGHFMVLDKAKELSMLLQEVLDS